MNRDYHSMLRILNTYEQSIYHVIEFQPHHVHTNRDFTFWSNYMVLRLVL
jgi:hypothetical protein